MKTMEDLIEEKVDYKIGGVLHDHLYCEWEDLQQILSAPTKEQTECLYCHDELGVPKSRKEYVHDAKAVGKGVYKESYLNDIKFCDVCGRKLKEDVE